MAEVYKAQYRGRPNVVVAIKRILPQFSQDKKLVSMLVNEARLSMSLNHPNIVPVLDFGVVDGDYFIAMEYVQGKDLKSIMIRCKMREVELPMHMSIAMMIQVLRALDYAHHKRDNFDQPLEIVHRDVSPHNIMISLWGQVKILDFGIAKAGHIASSTQTGILKGKFSYMSPEQAMGKEIDLKTDIYSAGIVFWELLTLDNYFQGQTDIRLLEHVRGAEFRDPRDINPKVPRKLVNILSKALNKKPRKRYANAEEFARALEKFQEDTFGQVTEMDLAAYVRNLFGVSAAELATLKPTQSPRDLITGEHQNPLTKTKLAENKPKIDRRPIRPPQTHPIFKNLLLIVIACGLGALFYYHNPQKLLKKADHEIIRLTKALRQIHPQNTSYPPVLIDLKNTPPKTSKYSLYFSPTVQSQMEELTFEEFEDVRHRTLDLASEPYPRAAKNVPKRPGSFILDEGSFKIVFKVSDESKTITITQLK